MAYKGQAAGTNLPLLVKITSPMPAGGHPLGAGGEEFIAREWKTPTVFMYCLSENLQGSSKIWLLRCTPQSSSPHFFFFFQCTISFVCLYFYSMLSLICMTCLKCFRQPHFCPCFKNNYPIHHTYLLSLSFVFSQFLMSVCINRTNWKDFVSIKGFVWTFLSVQGKG